MARNGKNADVLHFNPEDVRDFFLELRSQKGFPNLKADTLLALYDLLCVLNVREERIAEWFGPRGYLHVARFRCYSPSGLIDRAFKAIDKAFGLDGDEDQTAGE